MLQELRDNGLIECDVFILLTADYDVICKRNNMRKHMLEGICLEEETIINQRYVLEKIVADIVGNAYINKIKKITLDTSLLSKEQVVNRFNDIIKEKEIEK